MTSPNSKVNIDLENERKTATIDIASMKLFLGELTYFSLANYNEIQVYRKKLVNEIKPIFEENFYNLDRDRKYQMILKKSLELVEFVNKYKIENIMSMNEIGLVLGPEKVVFSLHFTMFRDSIGVWGTSEQKEYWSKFIIDNAIIGTYVQTEIGHGTYLRGLETTATYDKLNMEFIIDSPTLTSIKFWPGASAKTSNYAIVMCKLMIDDKEYGIHAFIVQLRSLENHRVVPGIEIGDIGQKFGFDATDNGYLKFNKLRIPRSHMLMQFARVDPDGTFVRTGSEVLMYAAMLLMRGTLSLMGSYYLSISTTIAIRYSCVRRQTVDDKGIEKQIIDYQTQQYRLFSSLASTYALTFTGLTLRNVLLSIQKEADNFKNVKPSVLAKLHAVCSVLKAISFGDCLKFAQSNRLCCGGHGYSASSGLSQIIQEADAGCTYEGDNVVLLLQTARYLLKCVQKNESPHLELDNQNEIKASSLYKNLNEYIEIFFRLFEESMNEATSKLFNLVKIENMPELEAWNQTSSQLIAAARVYGDIFVIFSNLSCILSHTHLSNQKVLSELFELYLLYEICEVYSTNILRLNLVEPGKMTQYKENLYSLLPKIRINAVALVDSIGLPDSALCSSLGAYDGNAYERLYDFAQKSLFNDKEVHDAYYKYYKPYAMRNKLHSKI